MQTKLLIALFAALALTACQKAEEAAAPAMEQAKEAAGAAAAATGDATMERLPTTHQRGQAFTFYPLLSNLDPQR